MSISQLIYSSEVNFEGFQSERNFAAELHTMLERAQENNQRVSVTGILLYSAGHFLQVLEGHPLVLRRLYGKISGDPRHKEVKELAFFKSQARIFDRWFMGLLNLDERHDMDPQLFEDFKKKAQFAFDDEAAKHIVIHLLRDFKERLELPLRQLVGS